MRARPFACSASQNQFRILSYMAREYETEHTDRAMGAPSIGPDPDQEQSMLVNEGRTLREESSAPEGLSTEGIGPLPLIRHAQAMHPNSLATLKENGFSENLHGRYRRGSYQAGRAFSLSLKGIKQWLSYRIVSWGWRHGYPVQHGFPLTWRLRRQLTPENLAEGDGLQPSLGGAFSVPRRRLAAIPFRRRGRGTGRIASSRQPQHVPSARPTGRTAAVLSNLPFPGYSTDPQLVGDSNPAGPPSRSSGYGPERWSNWSLRVLGKVASGSAKLARNRTLRPTNETAPNILTARPGSTPDPDLPLYSERQEPVLLHQGAGRDSSRSALPAAVQAIGTPQTGSEGLVRRSDSPRQNQNYSVLGPSPAVVSFQKWLVTPTSTKGALAVPTRRGGITGGELELGALSTGSGRRRPSSGEGKSTLRYLSFPLTTGQNLASIARSLGGAFGEKKAGPDNRTVKGAELEPGGQHPAAIGTTGQSQGLPLDRLFGALHAPIIKAPITTANETKALVPARAQQTRPALIVPTIVPTVAPTDAAQGSASPRVKPPTPSGAPAEQSSKGRTSPPASPKVVKDGPAITPAKPGKLSITSPTNSPAINRIAASEGTGAARESLSQGSGPLAGRDPNFLRRLRQQDARGDSAGQEKKQPLPAQPGDGTGDLAAASVGPASPETRDQGTNIESQNLPAIGAAAQLEQPSSMRNSTGLGPDLSSAESGNDPTTSNLINTVREPKAMSKGLASRLGEALHWRASLVSAGSTEVVTFQPTLDLLSSPMDRKVKWDSTELNPMVADKKYQGAPHQDAPPRILDPSLRPVPQSVPEAAIQTAAPPSETAARENRRVQLPSSRFYGRGNRGDQAAADHEENQPDLTVHRQTLASDINRRQLAPVGLTTRTPLELIRRAVRSLNSNPLAVTGVREETDSKMGSSSRQFNGNESGVPFGSGVRSTSASPTTTPKANGDESGLTYKNPDKASGHEEGKRESASSVVSKPWHIFNFTRRVPTKRGPSTSPQVQRSEATKRRQFSPAVDAIQIRKFSESSSAPTSSTEVSGPVKVLLRNQRLMESPAPERNPQFTADFETSAPTAAGVPESSNGRSSPGKPEIPGQGPRLKGILERTRRFVVDSRELILDPMAPVLGRERDDIVSADRQQQNPLRPTYRSNSHSGNRTDGGSPKETGDFLPAANRPSPQVLQGQPATPVRTVPPARPRPKPQRRHPVRVLRTVLSHGAFHGPARREPGRRDRGRSISTDFLLRAGIVSRLPLAGKILTLRLRKPAALPADSTNDSLASSNSHLLPEVSGSLGGTVSVLGHSAIRWNGSAPRPDTYSASSQLQEQDRSVPSVSPMLPGSATGLTGNLAYSESASERRRGALQRVYRLFTMAGEMILRRPKDEIATATLNPESQPAPARPEKAAGILVFRSLAWDSKEQEGSAPRQLSWMRSSMPRYRPVSNSTWSSSLLKLPNREASIPSVTGPSRIFLAASRGQRAGRRRPAERIPNGSAGEKLTMAQLLDSANDPPQEQDLVLQTVTVGKSTGSPSLPGSVGGSTSDKGRILRRRVDVPDPDPVTAQNVPKATLARRPKSERRSNLGPSSQASDHGGRDVTDFKGWEIEYLASKVYGYLQRKLDIERERHGHAGFNPWL